MMYLKIMSHQEADDTDPCKDCTVMPLSEEDTHAVAFIGPTVLRPVARVEITRMDRSTHSYDVYGNVYLFDAQMQEVVAFGVAGVGLDDTRPLIGRERHLIDHDAIAPYKVASGDEGVMLESTSNLNNDPLLAQKMRADRRSQ